MLQNIGLKKPKRKYQGQDSAAALVAFLNSNNPDQSGGRKRITAILEKFHEILRSLPELLASKRENLLAAQAALNSQVEHYERTLMFSADTYGVGWSFDWGLSTSNEMDWDRGEEWGMTAESDAIDA